MSNPTPSPSSAPPTPASSTSAAAAARPASASPSVSLDPREKDEMLAAARKKLQKYRKTKKAKRSSTSGSISSLRSTITTSSSSSSLANLSGSPASPGHSPVKQREPHQHQHARKRSSLGGGSKGSLGAFRMPLVSAPAAASAGGNGNALASGSGHGRGPSFTPGGGHGHKRSMSTKFAFPLPAASAVGGPPLAGRKPRPVSMSYAAAPPPPPSSSFAPSPNAPSTAGAFGSPALPGATLAGTSARRHSHRRSLSVSTKHGSLSLLLPPDVAAKLAGTASSSAANPSSAADERRRALEALEGAPSRPAGSSSSAAAAPRPLSGLGVSGWDTPVGLGGDASSASAGRTADLSEGRVVLPDFGSLGEDESFQHAPPAFAFPTSPGGGGGGRASFSKRDSWGKLGPPSSSSTSTPSNSSAYLSLPPPSSSSSSTSTSSPNPSTAAPAAQLAHAQVLPPGSPTLASPRFGPDGFPLGLGGIAEEEESSSSDHDDADDGGNGGGRRRSEKDVRRASQQVSLPPARFGRFLGTHQSPRLASFGSSTSAGGGGGWGGALSPRERAGSAPDGLQPPTTTAAAAAQNEEDRVRSFSFGAPSASGSRAFPSSPLAGQAFGSTSASASASPLVGAGSPHATTAVDSPVFDGPRPSFAPSDDDDDPPAPAKPADEGSRFRAFAFPKGPVAPSPPPTAPAETSPSATSAGWESVADDDNDDGGDGGARSDGEKTPNPPASATFASGPALPSPAGAAPKAALRPLTLGHLTSPSNGSGGGNPSSGPPSRNLRPLSLSLASSIGSSTSASSTPSRPASTFGSGSSFGFVSPPPAASPAGAGGGRYGSSTLGYGRPRAFSGSRPTNLSLSSSTSSSTTASSAGGALARSNSLSTWTPSTGGTPLSAEKRRSSISYGKSPSPSPSAAAAGAAAVVGPAGKRSLGKCPTRPLSFASAATSSRRVLTDVGEGVADDDFEDVDDDDDDDDGRSLTSPFSHDDADPFVHRRPTSSTFASSPSDASALGADRSSPAAGAAATPHGSPSPTATAEEQRLRARLVGVESERDALLEDVDGWRARCRALEAKLAEEKRIAVVERDLARERIRKLGDRLASLTPDENTSAAHLTAQTRLVTEMRDQIFSLASSLARADELRRQADEALRDEVDGRERRVAEAVDEDRRLRPVLHPAASAPPPPHAVNANGAPQTPPLMSGSSNSSSVSSNVSTNRSSYGGPAVRLASAAAAAVDDDGAPQAFDSWKASPWGAGGAGLQPTGELDLEHFGVVLSPRALESLEEEAEEDPHPHPFETDDDGHHHTAYGSNGFNRSFGSSAAYDVSDDNAALGLDSSGDFDPDGFDEDVPYNFLSPRLPDAAGDDDEADPTTPVQPSHLPDDLTAAYGATPRIAAASTPSPPPPQQQQQPEPAIKHAKRHSLQRTWVMPRGPVGASPEPPQIAIVASVSLATAADELDDVKPFGTWVVPPSPFFNAEADDADSGRFAPNAFPSALYAPPPPPSSAGTTTTHGPASPYGGYNDPPAALLNGAGTHRPGAGNRSVSLPLPSARGPPPISRSAVYHAANPSIGSTSGGSGSGMSESTSMFSLTSLTSTLGSFVLPPKGSGPAGVLCSVIPEDDDELSAGQSSGQWVVRAHDSPVSSSSRPQQPPSTTTTTTRSRSGSTASSSFRLPQSSAARRASKTFVDPRNQPPPFASPVGLLDFRQTCCGDDWSAVIEL